MSLKSQSINCHLVGQCGGSDSICDLRAPANKDQMWRLSRVQRQCNRRRNVKTKPECHKSLKDKRQRCQRSQRQALRTKQFNLHLAKRLTPCRFDSMLHVSFTHSRGWWSPLIRWNRSPIVWLSHWGNTCDATAHRVYDWILVATLVRMCERDTHVTACTAAKYEGLGGLSLKSVFAP